MKTQPRKLILLLILLVLLAALWWSPVALISFVNIRSILSLVLPETVTPESLQTKYSSGKLKILLVPGHDWEYDGAHFRNLNEAAMTLGVARYLVALLREDNRFEVASTRDLSTGEYSDELSSYFKREKANILAFITERKLAVEQMIQKGELVRNVTIDHNFALPKVAERLYAINRYANQTGVDLLIHLHFNDYPGRPIAQVGRHSGFAVYVPERQYPNARASRQVADAIFSFLSRAVPVSDYLPESEGIIEAQELIALGSNASQKGASVLIEYGYISEPQFSFPQTREYSFYELAWQTAAAVRTYFDQNVFLVRDTTLLPYTWENKLAQGLKGSRDVLALQAALRAEGVYPPPGKTLSDCPINGTFGPCVNKSVRLFQQKHNLPAITGFVGPATLERLNNLYSS